MKKVANSAQIASGWCVRRIGGIAVARRLFGPAAVLGGAGALLLVSCCFVAGSVQAAYKWRNVAIGGGGYVTGIVAHPREPGLIYLRTDVGGAYRWDGVTGSWISLTDGFGAADSSLYSGEGIAVDAQNPDVVYWAAGGGPNEAGDIFKSTNRGTTWTRLGVNVRMNGNGRLRSAGERLVVDPNNSEVIYFGSRYSGLLRSMDGGATWSPVTAVAKGTAGEGVIFVAFDASTGTPGNTTQTVYTAVRGPTTPEGETGIFRSTDGGTTWSIVAGSPIKPRRGTAVDGTLWVTHDSGVSKYDGRSWTHYTPGGTAAYGALGVEPANSQVVIAVPACGAFNCRIYRTTDGGATWTSAFTNTTSSGVPWWPARWFSAATSNVLIDPSDTKRVWLADWFGVWRTDDVTVSPKAWHNHVRGYEPVVTTALKSTPSGAALLHSGLADVGGLRHASVEAYPGAADRHDDFGDITDIDFQESDPDFVAAVGGRRPATGAGRYSTDNGVTWTAFPSAPTPDARNGRVAVSACVRQSDPRCPPQRTILWAPDGQGIYRSADDGRTWAAVSGGPAPLAPSTGIDGGLWEAWKPLASDRVNGNKFYALKRPGSISGTADFYVSTDAGVSWSKVASLPISGGWLKYAVKAAPGVEGEIWANLGTKGLWYSRDSGVTWVRLAGVERADLIALGSSNGGPPTVFVLGQVNGVKGIFRSTDRGETWVQIDAGRAVLLAKARVMEADRRTFGRVYVGTGGRGVFYGDTSPLIANAEFDEEMANWTFQPISPAMGSATAVSDGGLSGPHAARIRITAAGTYIWHIQLKQAMPAPGCERGRSYKVTFMARASANREIRIAFQQGQAPWTQWYSHDVALTTTGQSFGPYTFKATTDDPTCMLKFYAGSETGDVYLDNVLVTD